jgi:hypothetical protein
VKAAGDTRNEASRFAPKIASFAEPMNWLPRYVRLSLSRLWIRDLVHFGSKARVVGGTTSLRVSDVAMSRRSRQPLISWNAILVKAIAITSQKWPQLKRAYIPFPWPHLYEHPHCVVSLVLEREWRGEHSVFFDQIHAPEHKSLREIDHELSVMKGSEVESVGGFRRLIRITRYPLPLRRLIWRIALYGSGRMKSRYFGTFSLNSLASRHLRTTQSTTLVSISFEYSATQLDGHMPVQIFFDHRVIDGVAGHRLCADLQSVLNHEIVAELNKT